MVEHVVRNFPADSRFVFICNLEHLKDPELRMKEALREVAPHSEIVGVPPHKLGPVHAVLATKDVIDDSLPTIVNYCDFGWVWDWEDFLGTVRAPGVTGSIVTYTGFHPHMRHSTNYAYVRVERGAVKAIQEKQPFTVTPMREHASSGTYYFASGGLMLEAFEQQTKKNLHTNGEFYVSLSFQHLLDRELLVTHYTIPHFMQWGTPADLAEYVTWSDNFHALLRSSPAEIAVPGDVIMPMAGRGSRFSDAGWTMPKPLIQVSGKPMSAHAVAIARANADVVIVTRRNHGEHDLDAWIDLDRDPARVHILEVAGVTQGQAVTSRLGIEALSQLRGASNQVQVNEECVTVVPSDAAILLSSAQASESLMADDWDLIVWTSADYTNALRAPEQYGWLKISADDNVVGAYLKIAPDSPSECPIIIGCFTFRTCQVGMLIIDEILARDERVNGEFYLDSAVPVALQLGLRVKQLPVNHFFCWGTPDELLTFQYWQRCFNRWIGHPYRVQADKMIPDGLGGAVLENAAAHLEAALPTE